jgi:MtN3 and saliva related transmembrane protein
MKLDWITLIGLVAAACTTLSFLPQVFKTVQTKKTQDLSLGMYVVLTLGLSLWMVYGLITKDFPLILANSISASLSAFVLYMKIRHG